jgi:hypothetical protein
MSKSFTGVTPDKFALLKKLLADGGITMPDGNSGTISITSPAKIDVQFDYNGTDTLALTILEKPFFVAESMIWEKIESSLGSI